LESVGRRTAFAEVLDRKLQAVDAPLPRVSAQYGHRATVHTFFEFAAATKPVTPWHPRHPYATPAAADRLPRPEAADRKRRLSAQEQSALEQLNALGANVRPDFTAGELRRAFRSLALAFHPDRHPRSTGTETAALSRNFVVLHDAYRALQILAAATI